MLNMRSPLDGVRSPFGKSAGGAPYTVSELSALIADAGGSWWRTADITSMWQGAMGGGVYLLAGAAASEGQPVAHILDIAQFGGLSASDFIAAQAELVANGGMDSDTAWTKGTGWGIAAGVATHAGVSTGNLTQNILTQNDWYLSSWDQSGGFISAYLGFSTGLVLIANLDTTSSNTSIGQSTGTGAIFAFRSAVDGVTVDNVSVKKLPGRPARATNITFRPTLSANGLLSFDGAGDLLVANIVTSLGSACTKITSDAEDVTITEGQTVGAGSYSLPDTGWTDHILLPVSLATAGISSARLRSTLL